MILISFGKDLVKSLVNNRAWFGGARVTLGCLGSNSVNKSDVFICRQTSVGAVSVRCFLGMLMFHMCTTDKKGHSTTVTRRSCPHRRS